MSSSDLKTSSLDDDLDNHDGGKDTTTATAKPVAAGPANVLLAGLALDAAMPRTIRDMLAGTPGRVVVIVVPSAAQVAPAGKVLRDRYPKARLHLVTERTKNWSVDDPMPDLLTGRSVVAVSQNPELLRSPVPAVADAVVTVAPPDAAMVRKCINAVTGGRSRGLTDADVAERDFEQLAACIRPGSTAGECVWRIKQLGSGIAPVVEDAPELATLPVFGEARAWASGALADLERMRRGELTPADIEHVLLYGPPGTGKTLLARALAKAAGVRFFETSVADWFTGSNGYLDGVLKAAEAFFATLKDNAPAIGFLDELDAVPDRAALDGRNREWWQSVITGLLLMVSRLRETGTPVLLIGATNAPGRIDAALIRPGRLGRHVLVRAAQTENEAFQLFAYYVGSDLKGFELAILSGFAPSVTPAQVESWVKAGRRAALAENRPLNLDDVVNQINRPDGRSADALRHVALHEAGHAVAALVLGHQLQRVSIVSEGTTGGVTIWQPRGLVHTLRDIEDQVVLTLAGRAADQLLGGGADTGAASDLAQATHLLAAAETSLGLRDRLAHRADDTELRHLLRIDPELLERVETQLQAQMTRAKAVVGLYSDAITAVAEELQLRRVLTGDQVASIVTSVMQKAHPGIGASAQAAE